MAVSAGRMPVSSRRAIVAMLAGLTLQVVIVVVAYVDRDGLAAHVRAGYPEYPGERVDSAAMDYLMILTVVGGLGTLGWIGAIWAVKTRKAWDTAAATVLLMAGAVTALYLLLVHDTSGETALPALLGWLGAVPCLAGLVAVVLLVRR